MGNERIYADIARMENKIESLKEEMRSRPDRRELYEEEIKNLEYEIRDLKRRL